MSLLTVLMVVPQISFAADTPCRTESINKSGQNILANVQDRFAAIKKNGGKTQWSELAKATFYHNMFNGRTTSNGTVFWQHHMLAAHNHRAKGSKVTVENPKTGQFACVTIADTGRLGRDHIDLSKAAFAAVGFTEAQGTGKVNIINGWRSDCPAQPPLQMASRSQKSPKAKRMVASKTRRTANADH